MQHIHAILISLLLLGLAACRQTDTLETEPPPSPTEALAQAATEVATAQPPTPTPLAATATATQAPTDTPAATPTAPTATPSSWPTPSSLPLPISQELSFEVVAHEGGHVQSVAADGNIAYVGIGPRLVMLDVTNSTNVQPIARSPVLPSLVRAVLPQEHAIYAAAGQQLVALEIGDGELNVVARLELPGQISHLLSIDNLLYATGTVLTGLEEQPTGFLAVVSPTATGELSLVDTSSLPAAVRGVAQTGDDFLYLALDGKWRDNYIVFDLAGAPPLADPITVAIPVSDEVHSLQTVGDTLLIGGFMALYAVDISASPDTGSIRGDLLWEIEASPDLFLPMVEGMAVAGDTIYTVGNIPAGTYIPSRLAVPAPEPLAGTPSPPTSPLIALSNNRLFVAEGTWLEIYDISIGQPGQLSSIAGYGASFPNLVSTLAIDESAPGEEILYLYSGYLNDSYPEQLFTFRLLDLQALGELIIPVTEEAHLNVSALFDLLLHGGEAYAVAADGIHQIGVSYPAAPQPMARYPFAAHPLDPRGLVAAGDTLYLGLHRDPHIAAITFAGGSAQEVDQLGPLQGKDLQGIAATDDTLYVTTSDYENQGWLHTIDISGSEMKRLATMPLPGEPVWALATDGTVLATAIQNQLILINVADPSQPELLANLILPTRATDPVPYVDDISFHDGLLFVMANSYLLAIDLTDPTTPRAIGSFDLPYGFSNLLGDLMAFSGDTVVIGNGPVGIFALQMSR